MKPKKKKKSTLKKRLKPYEKYLEKKKNQVLSLIAWIIIIVCDVDLIQ